MSSFAINVDVSAILTHRARVLRLGKTLFRTKQASIRARPSRALDLYGARFDFPPCTSRRRVEHMLAAVPRSGSTYLAIELWRSGVMGAPLEYANPPFANVMRERLNLSSRELFAYWAAVRSLRTSSNGVVGYKVFVADYLNWGRKYPGMLSEITPDKVIFLTRSNLVEQAVSYSKAIRSGVWYHGVRERIHPDYDADHIERCLNTLQFQIDFWHELFQLTGTVVYHVTYEALLEEPRTVIAGIADFLEVSQNATATIDLPHMQVQRDAESAGWVERFRSREEMAALNADGNRNAPGV